MVPGGLGQFEVLIDDEVVIGKEPVGLWAKLFGNKGIPEPNRVVEALRAHPAFSLKETQGD